MKAFRKASQALKEIDQAESERLEKKGSKISPIHKKDYAQKGIHFKSVTEMLDIQSFTLYEYLRPLLRLLKPVTIHKIISDLLSSFYQDDTITPLKVKHYIKNAKTKK